MANQYDTNLKLQDIADAIGDSGSSGLISALEDIADAVAGGGGGSSAGLVSDNFSETDTYDLGDYCIHNNTLYVCINAITTPGPWDLSDWQATNAGLELSSLNSALTWRYLDEATGQTHIALPNNNDWQEICVYWFDGRNSNYRMMQIIPRLVFDSVTGFIAIAEGSAQEHYGELGVANTREIYINAFYSNGAAYTSTAKIIVYIR